MIADADKVQVVGKVDDSWAEGQFLIERHKG